MFLTSVVYVIVFRQAVLVVISIEINNATKQEAKIKDIAGVLWCILNRQMIYREVVKHYFHTLIYITCRMCNKCTRLVW
jgi:predicted metal-binding protein